MGVHNKPSIGHVRRIVIRPDTDEPIAGGFGTPWSLEVSSKHCFDQTKIKLIEMADYGMKA